MAPCHQILVVEDDPSVLRLTRTILEHAGYFTEGAMRGDLALDLLEQRRFDLACIDLMLPNLSGFEVCSAMRRRPHLVDLPVLVLSARSLPFDRADAFEAGANAYLGKPFTRSKLLATIDALLRPRERPATPGGAS